MWPTPFSFVVADCCVSNIIAPFFVSFFNLPVYTVAGAALMGTFVTSAAGLIFYQAMAPWFPNVFVAPDLLLGILFGLGGTAGMYFGARCQNSFRPGPSSGCSPESSSSRH